MRNLTRSCQYTEDISTYNRYSTPLKNSTLWETKREIYEEREIRFTVGLMLTVLRHSLLQAYSTNDVVYERQDKRSFGSFPQRRFINISGQHIFFPSSGIKQLKNSTWLLKTRPISCTETSVTKQQSALRNILEERRTHKSEVKRRTKGLLESLKPFS